MGSNGARVIALSAQKGGAGKSTIATSLAVAAAEAGEIVLAIDCDEQGTLTAWAQTRKGEAPTVATLPRADRLADFLDQARDRFTVVFLDTPGRDNALTHATMTVADLCLIPIRPTKADAHGNKPTVQACIRSGRRFAFLLNQCPTTLFSQRAHEMAAGLSTLGALALPMVGQRVDYQDAYSAGQGVTEYAPEGKAAGEMRQLWEWIAREVRQ